tara:strand:+ start:786 stop:2177 length:1392 start_codon:yes stop_codon:yes gene_type:complete
VSYSSYAIYNNPVSRKVTDVDSPNAAFFNMLPHWGLIEDLVQGTFKIRSEHRKYLPQEPREQDDSYDIRLARSVCPPYFLRLERMLAGMLTRKPVRLTDVPDSIREDLFDVDLEGNDLNIWTYETARKAIRYGHVGVLVDAPKEGNSIRPYWVTYTPREILGWRTEIVDGQRVLSQLRLMEKVVVPDGKYGEKTIEQVRVLERGRYELHRKNNKSDFVLYEEGVMSTESIPFAIAYSNRVGYLESRPPMADIAELNLIAYQTLSDLANQLHISAVPMLAMFGFPAAAEEVSAGPSEALSLPQESRIEYIEPEGRSFDAQFRRLDQLEKQINELGLAAVLGQKLSAETAEAKRIDRSQGDSTMQVIAQQMQDLIDNCLKFHAQYLNEPTAGSSFVNRDFLASRLDPQDVQALIQLRAQNEITQKTLLSQLTEGEVLGDDFDIEEELESTASGGLVDMNPPDQAE